MKERRQYVRCTPTASYCSLICKGALISIVWCDSYICLLMVLPQQADDMIYKLRLKKSFCIMQCFYDLCFPGFRHGNNVIAGPVVIAYITEQIENIGRHMSIIPRQQHQNREQLYPDIPSEKAD